MKKIDCTVDVYPNYYNDTNGLETVICNITADNPAEQQQLNSYVEQMKNDGKEYLFKEDIILPKNSWNPLQVAYRTTCDGKVFSHRKNSA